MRKWTRGTKLANTGDRILHATDYFKAFCATKTKADRLRNCVKVAERLRD